MTACFLVMCGYHRRGRSPLRPASVFGMFGGMRGGASPTMVRWFAHTPQGRALRVRTTPTTHV